MVLGNEPHSPAEIRAIEEIFSTYGVAVSFREKMKALAKFGRIAGVASETFVTIAQLGVGEAEETFATGNTIDRIVSTNDGDTAPVLIEGHELVSGNLIFRTQTITLTGNTPAPLSIPLCRSTRGKNAAIGSIASPASPIAGLVSVYDSTVATSAPSGVPSNATATKLTIPGGRLQQSQKCATSISYQDYWAINRVTAGLARDSGNTVSGEISVEFRQNGGPWLPALPGIIALRRDSQHFVTMDFDPWIIVPYNSDVRMTAIVNASATSLFGTIQGLLAIAT